MIELAVGAIFVVVLAILTAGIIFVIVALRALRRSNMQLLLSLEEANRVLAAGAMATDMAVRNRIAATFAKPGGSLPPQQAAAMMQAASPAPPKKPILSSLTRGV
jgi:hypothetical protein